MGTVAELFAGVGGFRLGLEAANWETIFSNQYEPATPKNQHASRVYLHQYPNASNHFNVDIAELIRKKKHFPLENKVDLVVGGFPCQDYSVAKSLTKAHGLEGKKGVLWWEIVKFIKKVKPNFIFLENVDRLLKSPVSQKGRDFAIMLRTLGDLGYFIEWRVVNSADFGFPQRRIRVFIVARKLGVTPESWLSDPESTVLKTGALARAFKIKGSTRLEQIVLKGKLDEISATFGAGKSKSPWGNAGIYFESKAYPYKVTPRLAPSPGTLGQVLEPENLVPPEFRVIGEERLAMWQETRKGSSKRRVHKSGFEYTYSEGAMPFPDSTDKPSRTILTAEGGSTPTRFKHIIETSSGFRRLVPSELEKLNDFPKGWTEKYSDGTSVPDSKRAFFMGNALVVGLVEMVGNVLAADFQAMKLANKLKK